MKVVYSQEFRQVYSSDPAAGPGRMEAIESALAGRVDYVEARPAAIADISAVHTDRHIGDVRREGIFEIAALAAGGAIQAAEIGLVEPCFALIRPPGHHASAGRSWGFCYFNNLAVALMKLKRENKMRRAFVLDFDLHLGDGNVNILGGKDYITILNPNGHDRNEYLRTVQNELTSTDADMIAVSAGFDNHEDDWGGLLKTEDYNYLGRLVHEAALRNKGGCFGILEGGYNHTVLGRNVLAFIEGLEGKQK